MPYRDHKGFIDSARAASIVLPLQPVRLSASANEFLPLANASVGSVEPYAVAGEAGATVGEQLTVYGEDNVVKAKAATTIAFGAQVAPAIGGTSFAPVAGASGFAYFRAGFAREAAAAGESFALKVSIRQLSGLV